MSRSRVSHAARRFVQSWLTVDPIERNLKTSQNGILNIDIFPKRRQHSLQFGTFFNASNYGAGRVSIFSSHFRRRVYEMPFVFMALVSNIYLEIYTRLLHRGKWASPIKYATLHPIVLTWDFPAPLLVFISRKLRVYGHFCLRLL